MVPHNRAGRPQRAGALQGGVPWRAARQPAPKGAVCCVPA